MRKRRFTGKGWAWIRSTSWKSPSRSRKSTASSFVPTTATTSGSSVHCATSANMSSVIEPVERRLRAEWRKGLMLLAALVGYQMLLHWAIASDPGSGLGESLTIAPLATALVWVMGRSWRGRLGLTALTLAAVGGWIVWRGPRAEPALVSFVPHGLRCLFTPRLFVAPPRPRPRGPVTSPGRRVHRPLP